MSGVLYTMHVGICVRDLERSVRFYRDGLGFVEDKRLRVEGEPSATLLELPPEMVLDAVYLERDGLRIELLDYPTPGTVGKAAARPMNQLGLTHIALRVESLEATLARVVELGGRLVEGSRVQNETFGSDVAFAMDPDGTRLELVEAPGDPTRSVEPRISSPR